MYPIVDRPDWDNLNLWHRSGLWDEDAPPGEFPKRILHQPSANALLEVQRSIQACQAFHSPEFEVPKAGEIISYKKEMFKIN